MTRLTGFFHFDRTAIFSECAQALGEVSGSKYSLGFNNARCGDDINMIKYIKKNMNLRPLGSRDRNIDTIPEKYPNELKAYVLYSIDVKLKI
jgi:hypothetical protein